MSTLVHPLMRAITALALVVLVAPMLVVMAVSVTSNALLQFPPVGLSFRWYRTILERPEFVEAFLNSLWLALATSLLATVLGSLAAIGIHRHRFVGRRLMMGAMLSPLILPQLVLGIALLTYFSRLGLRSSFLGLLLAHILIAMPYVLRLVLVSLERVDPNLERAAAIAGGSPSFVFRTVTIWLLAPGLLAGAAFAFVMSFDNLVMSLFLTGTRFTTLPVEIYGYLEYADDPLLAAISTTVIVLMVLLLLLIEKTVGFSRAFTDPATR